jgi:hypothetical protein
MGTGRYRLTREDLEAMRKEFGLGRYDQLSQSLDDDLHQVRRNAGLGVSLEDWAKTRGAAYLRQGTRPVSRPRLGKTVRAGVFALVGGSGPFLRSAPVQYP